MQRRLIVSDAAAEAFPVGLVGFGGEDPFLGGAAAGAFLASGLFHTGAVLFGASSSVALDLVEEQAQRQFAVSGLVPGRLAFDPGPGGTMEQHDAGGRFVDILPAMAAGADEGFLDVFRAHVQRLHAESLRIVDAGEIRRRVE